MTIYDIAQEAGVSASTVSRVINKKKGVNPKKRVLVESFLKKYNFEPDASARGLVQQSTKIIGILMSDIRTSHHASGTYFIEQELKKHGYSCIIINAGFSDEARKDSIRTLASRRVEAVVLIGSTFQTENTKKAIEEYLSDLPVIIENGYIDLPNVYGVLVDEGNGISDCVRYLYKKGRRNMVFLHYGDTPSNDKKIRGFQSALHELLPQQEPVVIRLGTEAEEWQASHDATQRLMREIPDTDSIIYATDLLANAGCLALRELGIAVPEQAAIIGVDNSIYAKIAWPPITSLDNKLEDLSITCSNILVRVLNGDKVAHKMMIFSNIVERTSA